MLRIQDEHRTRQRPRSAISGRTGWFWASRVRAIPRRAAPEVNSITACRSALAVVPEIDHCIGKGLECVVQLTETIKTKQQSPELVFPSKHAFDRSKSLFEYGWLKQRLAASLGLFSTTLVDRQLLPLTTHMELLQNVVEDLEQTQLQCRPAAADGQVRQDKLLKQFAIQLRRNCLSMAASSGGGALWRRQFAVASKHLADRIGLGYREHERWCSCGRRTRCPQTPGC